MSRPGGPMGLTHIFSELSSQDELNVPLGRSARLRYTCLSVCGKYIALGSNSGGTYIFSRDTLKYLQVVFSDKNAVPVDLVSLSPSDHLIGLGLSNGQVTVFELNIEKRSKPEKVRQTLDHSGHGVTVMTWDSTSSRLYVGDDTGKISVVSVPSSKTKTLFSAPSQVIALLDSSVYQIQWWKEKLLVSTVTHSHLFDTTKHTYSTIGTKPRAGEFGSCFFLEPNSQVPVIYCARPGSRMWEVSFEGKVLNTHQFKQLMAVPPVPVVRSRSETFDYTNEIPYQGLSTNFLKMFSMGHFIITWSSKGLYMFDPINVKLAMWTQSIKSIKDVCVYRNDIYLFLENTTVRRLTILPIYQLFTVLASRQRWTLLAQMLLAADVVNFRPAALKKVKRDLLFNIYQGLKQNGKEQLLEKVRASMEDVSEGSVDSLGPDATEDFLDSLELKGYIFLSSGMVVREGLGIDGGGGGNGEGASFERYVPSQGQLERSASDESFYKEEIEESRKEGVENEDRLSPRENLVGDEVTDSTQHVSAPTTEMLRQTETAGPSESREDHPQAQTQLSLPAVEASADESAEKTEANPTSEFDSPVDKTVVEHNHKEDDSKSCTNQLQTKTESVDEDSLDYVNTVKRLAPDPSEESVGKEHKEKENFMTDLEVGDNNNESESLESMTNSIKGMENGNSTNCFEQEGPLVDKCSETLPSKSSTNLSSKSAEISDNFESEPPIKSKSQTLKETNCSPVPNHHQNHFSRIDHQQDQILAGLQDSVDSKADVDEAKSIPAPAIPGTSPHSPSALEQAHQILSDFHVPHKILHPNESEKAQNKDEVSLPTDRSHSKGAVVMQNNTEKNLMVGGQTGPAAASKPSWIEELKDQRRRSEGQLNSRDSKTLARFASVPAPTGKDDEIIAKPHRNSKKKSRSKRSSQDALTGKFSRSASVGTETEAFTRRAPELDTISVSTISSVEEEEELATKSYPDLRSSEGGIKGTLDVHRIYGAASSMEDRRHSETIPPLVDRLAAAQSLESSGEFFGSNSLTSSGEHGLIGASTLGPLSVLKDGLSLKLKNQTKSFIKSLKETNILTKSASASRLDKLSDQQRSQQDLSISPPPYGGSPASPPLSPSSVKRGLEEPMEELLTFDTAPLYTLALEIKKKLLASPNALLDPKQLQTLLGSWAKEIVLAVGKVSVELYARKKLAEPMSESAIRRQVSPSTSEHKSLLHQQKPQTDPHNIVFHGSEKDTATIDKVNVSLPNSSVTSTSPGQTCSLSSSLSMETDNPSKQSPSSTESTSPTGLNWGLVIQANSPFVIPTKHLELFQWLTTRCWLCGVTGDVVSTLYGLSTTATAGVVNLQNKPTSETEEEENSDQSDSQEDCLPRESSGIIYSEENFVSMLRIMLPPKLFESFMEQNGKTIPPVLSLLSDVLISSSHSNNTPKDRDLSLAFSQYFKSSRGNNFLPCNQTDSGSNVNRRNCSDLASKSGGLTPRNSAEGNVILEKGSSYCTDINNVSANSDSNEEYDRRFMEQKEHMSSLDDVTSISSSKMSPEQNPPASEWGDEALRQDTNLALFTRLLFFLLDFDQVRCAWEERRTWEKPLLLTWISLISCSEVKGVGDIVSSILADRQTKSAVDYLRSGILPYKSAMLGHLLELFKQAPLMASDFCGELSKVVLPLDLVGMCALTSRPAVVHLVRYFKQAMLDTAAFFRPVKFDHLVSQPEIRHLLLQSQLPALSQVHSENTSSGVSAALATELRNVLPANWMEIIVAKIKSDEERESIIWLCSQFQYYRLCIRLLAQADQWRRLLSWIVQLDDIRLLQSRQCYPEAYLPRDITEWTFLLACMRENYRSRVSPEQYQSDHVGSPKASGDTDSASMNVDGQTDDTAREETLKEEASPSEIFSDHNGEGEETHAKQANVNEDAEEALLENPLLAEFNAEDIHLENGPCDERSLIDEPFEDSSIGTRDKILENTHSMAKKGEFLSQDTALIKENLELKSGNDTYIESEEDRKELASPWALTWGNVGYLLLEHLGGATAINLLVSYMTEEGDDPGQAWSGLGSEFIQACYSSFLLEGQKDQVSHEMLERMSVFMWAQKPGFLSPSVHHAFKAEQNLVEKKQGRETDVQRVFGQVKSLSNKSLKSEYLGGHWGVSTDLSRRCGVCNLPLKTVMSLSVQGAVVFPCSHAYHRCCMSGSTCPQLH